MKSVTRIIRLDSDACGAKLASSVYGRGGVVYKAGEVLDASAVTLLASLGITHIRIQVEPNAAMTGKVPDAHRPGIRERSAYRKLLSALQSGSNLLKKENGELRQQVFGCVKGVSNEMKKYPSAMLALTSVDGPGEGYLLRHSTNVCILSLACGIWLGYDDQSLKELGIAALLHDIGMTRVKGVPWSKKKILSESERHEMKKHTLIGRDVLEAFSGFGVAATVAHQHHENVDGSGYPRGLVRGRLHPFTRIVSVCDRYEAIASTRVHRKGAGPTRSLKMILADAGVGVDRQAARVLMSNLSLYPVGTRVRLSDGRTAWVVSAGKTLFQPIVQPTGDTIPLQLDNSGIEITASLN